MAIASAGGLLVLCLCVLASGRTFGQVYQSDDQLWTTGDFDGDGIRDVAVVERESGAIRLGRGQADGSLVWDPPRPTDLTAITSIAAERFDTATRDSLALVSPTANHAVRWRLNGATPEVLSIPVAGLGPALVAAGAAADTTNRPQLAVVSALNSGPATDNLHLLRVQGGVFQANVEEPFGAAADFLGRADLGVAAGARNFVLREVSGLPRLEIYDFGASNRSVLASAPLAEFTAQARALPIFVSAGVADLLAFEPGQSNLLWFRLTVTNSATTLGAPVALLPTGPVADVFPISTGASWRIALRETGDGRLAVYDFSSAGGPQLVLQGSLNAASQDALLGVLPGNAGELLVLAGDAGSTRIQRSIRYAPNGASYVEVSRQALPAVTPWTIGANVFLLSAPPFTTTNAVTLATLRVGDWTDSLLLGTPPGGGTVVAETFGGAATGLAGPTPQVIGVPGGAQGGLINEYRPNVSVLSWAPANSDPLPEVRPSPPAGIYSPGLIVQLATLPALPVEPGQTFYRTSGGTWLAYSGSAGVGPLSQNTSLDMFWRRNRDGARGPIFQAVYTIRSDESVPDCDHDGVPDFVEVLHGLDPCASGPDADHDGASDLAELLNGTSPNLSTNRPPPGSALNGQLDRAVFVALAPHSHAGTSNQPPQLLPSLAKDTNAASLTRATKLWLFNPFGEPAAGASPAQLDPSASTFMFAETQTLPLAGETFPAGLFTASDASFGPELLVGATEDHFDLRDGGTTITNRGRELLGFIAPPTNPPARFAFVPGTNAPGVEAARWLAEATAFYQSRQSPTQAVRLDFLSTLEVLLVEQTAGQLLQQRGSLATPRVTMAAFRAGEPLVQAGLDGGQTWSFVPFSRELMRALETASGIGQPAYSLTGIREAIHATLGDTNGPTGPLRDLAAEFYRLAAMSPTPSAVIPPSPVDALRSFLHDGTNHQVYLTSSNWGLSSAQMDVARTAARNLSNQVPALVEQTWIVRLNGDLLHDHCVPWSIEGSGQTLALVDAQGQPYALQFGFGLATGARVRVRGYAYTGPPAACAGVAVRPTHLELLEAPAATPGDLNGNGVSDDLERYHFGALVSDPTADRDYDGVPDLVEVLLGTDPNDGRVDCSTNKLVECGTLWSFDRPPVTGGCCPELTFTLISSNAVLDLQGQITWAGAWFISDCCFNSLLCTQLVTIVHTQPPQFTCAANKMVQAGTVWDFDPPTASAPCCTSNVAITVLATVTNGTSPQVITRTWVARDCWGKTNTCSQAVTVVAPGTPPTITGQPQSQTAFETDAVSLSVNATGSPPLAYQWYRDGQPLAGMTVADLTIPHVALAHAGTYHCRVTNNFGQAVSSNALLTVRPGFARNLLVYDGFAYSNNTQLVGQNGGFGWTGPWAGLAPLYSYFTNQPASLVLPGLPSYATAGGSIVIDLLPNSYNYIQRGLDLATTNVNELWFSVIIAGNGQYAGDRFFLYFDENLQNSVEVGEYSPGTGQPARWTISQQTSAMGPIARTNEPTLLLLQMVNTSLTTHQFNLYVNPLPGSTAPAPDASWTLTGTRLDRVYSIWFIVNEGGHHALDEVRVAMSFANINPPVAARLSVGFVNNQLQVRLAGTPGAQYRLELSPDLKNWQPVFTNSTPDGVIVYAVPSAGLGARGFYRAVLLP